MRIRDPNVPFVRPSRLPRALRSLGRTPAQRFTLLVAGGFLAFVLGRWTDDSTAKTAPSRRHREIPASVRGMAVVLDGDTLDIDGVRVRIHGIDAPEREQLCERADGSQYGCGQFARETMVQLIAGGQVTCTKRDVDPYGRMVGVCSGAQPDLGAAMVENGAAIAYRHYSMDYLPQENSARSHSRGVWQGRFEAPWDYRHRGQTKPETK